MNRYQMRRTKEIRQIRRRINSNTKRVKIQYGSVTLDEANYKYAERVWKFTKKLQLFHPCEDCTNSHCTNIGNVIAFCPNRT